MRRLTAFSSLSFCCISALVLCSCSSTSTSSSDRQIYASTEPVYQDFSARLPQTIASNEKTVVVDPRVHAWGAYEGGTLVKAGQASSGASYCPDVGRSCRTSVGSFRVFSLGEPTCKSRTFPIPKGGAPMPYCMYFSHGMALHGVPDNEVGDGNYSHGCVRMHVGDAEWLRYNFVHIGTRVVVKSY
jgi:hypothetical protein